MKNLFRPIMLALLVCSGFMSNAQVPVLSSYPSANAVIFLDFDGHTVAGTSWNYNGPIECGSSGLDNTKITEIFNRVAEDYRPFNVNVTTDSTKYLAAAANRRMRIILTVTSSWYGSAGGVAFVGSFIWTDNTPCFVFSALLGNNAKNISEAASHEAGHTLGLYHQANYDANCVKLSDYHSGTGSGEIGWAPIMGVGYYRNFTLWNNGPNSYGCNSMQSDLQVITSVNGFTYRNDDHTNAFNTATQANFNIDHEFTLNGVIERNTDQDLFEFDMPAIGWFELNAIPYNVGTGNAGSNLDMQVTLMDENHNVLNVYNPGALLSSVIDTLLSEGTYYIRVEGKGNLYAPAYASLGSYSLLGGYTIGPILPLHKLELTGTVLGDIHKLSWEIEADQPITELVLETATDGRNFHTLSMSAVDARTFSYRPSSNGSIQYRVNVLLSDGSRHYSNIITLSANDPTIRPRVVNTIVSDNNIRVNSPGKFTYRLYDLNGRTLRSGNLVSGINHIDAGGMINGMYMIRFADEQQQWTDKLVRQ